MRICGIVAEYNPFHKGHLYQIEQSRRILGEDTAIVACMSGDYVQRGEAAIMNKMLRAETAVKSGADLVVSLPLRWSLSSAQGFADGAVHILNKIGVDHISFGTEHDNIADLTEIAHLITEKSIIDGTIQNMTEGIPFALARERELYKVIKEKSKLISTPNNILAIEYLRAIEQQNTDITPLAVKRTGAGHDSEATHGDIASASNIRRLIRAQGVEGVRTFMPEPAFEVLRRADEDGLVLSDLARLDTAMTSVLGRLSIDDLACLPDISEGLEYRLYEAIQKGRTFEEICDYAKTKRYAHSRIRRILYCGFLGVKRTDSAYPVFTRVLAFNDRGRQVLANLPEHEDFAVITKVSSYKGRFSDLELESEASGVYDMMLPAFMCLDRAREWVSGPVYIKD